ncbi:ATP-binding protein [Phyllobacterium myrsinacearum]|uniref:histidine kinase n=1 Tax=Phyllobacterium myrsinacearum TaxID=28101 RepID=A0A839EP81_9HYPH|nr:ATP-binding protein [Phyllobacterium myrsinacearum]MBA8879304.1 two-component system sensor histidine kinase AdeS [Phyllobacterium myrsinacearum]
MPSPELTSCYRAFEAWATNWLTTMAKSLNTQMVIALSALTLLAFAVMFFGMILYWYLLDWIFPNAPETDKWTPSDFVALGLILATGLSAAAMVGWRLAQNILRPLKSIARAVSSIANGDFSARAEIIQTPFGEAASLIIDFNAMAMRLESAEAELQYSNSAIAHELRTPLTILRGRLQGLSDGLFKPTSELYGSLLSHVEDLALIVEDLRVLGLSNAGRLELKLDEIDLAEEAEAVATTVEQSLADAGITIKRDLGHAVTFADRARIRQVLFAILDNVRRYAPKSTVTIQTRKTKDRVLLRCSDNGPGLPAGAEKRVFERFWRADDSRARASGGTGLGLSVVQAIARGHGGDANVVDRENGGTSIEIWLPIPMQAVG